MPEEGYLVSPETLAKLGRGDTNAGRKLLRAMIDLETPHDIPEGPAEKPANVRRATEADEDAVLELIRLDYEENARSVNTLDEQKMFSFVQGATRENIGVIGVIDAEGGGLAGFVFVEQEQCWWTSDWNLAERITYVEHKYRKSSYAADLLNFAKWFADNMTRQLGYTVYLASNVAATKDAWRKSALFGRHMHFMGAHYVYPPFST